MAPMYFQHPLSQQAAPVQTNLTASSSQNSTDTLQQRKQRLQDRLQDLLAPNALTGAGAVKTIVAAIEDFGSQDVDPATRKEIVTRIRDNAGNHFFRAWSENADAMEILREWLKAGATGKDNGFWEETIMPLLHVRVSLTSAGFIFLSNLHRCVLDI